MAVVLDDVARVCGVSRATASRALSGGAHVSEGTRTRVQAAARSLGYRANHSARALAKGRTDVVGLVLPAVAPLTDPFHAMLLSSVAEGANSRGKGLMLWFSGLESTFDGQQHVANAAVVDGLIIIGTAFGTPWVDQLVDSAVPMTAIGPIRDGRVTHQVEIDNIGGGALAAEHLLNRGHTRLATITGPLDRQYARDRLAGFTDKALEHGVHLPDAAIAQGAHAFEDGVRAMEQLLSFEPTAVFVANDEMATGAYAVAQSAGLDIPGDVSIVGFDDLPQSAHMTPPLTTVRQDSASLADLALELLLEVIDDPTTAPVDVVSSVELVERSSTAARSD